MRVTTERSPRSSSATPSAEARVIPFKKRPSSAPGQPETVSDAELLRRCRLRDNSAWDELVSRYERLVYSVARRNGLGVEDAADVTQTTFVTLLDSLDRIRDEDKLPSWLMTVARRQSWRVRNASRRIVPVEEVETGAEDPLADWATLIALHDALADLGGSCRDLLLALYFEAERPSYHEIAERLGRSVGGIGPLRGRCLEKLRDLLGEDR